MSGNGLCECGHHPMSCCCAQSSDSFIDIASDKVAKLIVDALCEAFEAQEKFPQPTYIISKVAEEAGEVVKAAIHCVEGRESPENVRAEIIQAMAMLIRLYIEGDQVHGLPALVEVTE